MGLVSHDEVLQGSVEWHALRRGVLTASTVGALVSSRRPGAVEVDCPECGAGAGGPCVGKRSPAPLKTLHSGRSEVARGLPREVRADMGSDGARTLMTTLVAERLTGFTEEYVETRAMERGTLDEPFARDSYAADYSQVTETGFMTNEIAGYAVGYSPDGLVSSDGLIEIKSRVQRIQLETFLKDEVPLGNMAQIQFGLLVSGREWLDYVSYCGGMPLYVKRVDPDPGWFKALTQAVVEFEGFAAEVTSKYTERTTGLKATERIDHYAEIQIGF